MRIINAFTQSLYDFDALYNDLEQQAIVWLPEDILSYLDKNTLKSLQGKYTIKNGAISFSAKWDERKKAKDTLVQWVIESLKNDGVTPLLVSTINYLFSHGYPRIIIQNANKNMRLQQHNQTRSEKSIVSSWENLYTKKALQVWWVQNSAGDYVITPASYYNAIGNIYFGHQYLAQESLLHAKNNIFTPWHTARTNLFDITGQVDRQLLETFIQSPIYNAR
jgi:hypothetical protein